MAFAFVCLKPEPRVSCVFSVACGRRESSPAFQRGIGNPIDNPVPWRRLTRAGFNRAYGTHSPADARCPAMNRWAMFNSSLRDAKHIPGFSPRERITTKPFWRSNARPDVPALAMRIADRQCKRRRVHLDAPTVPIAIADRQCKMLTARFALAARRRRLPHRYGAHQDTVNAVRGLCRAGRRVRQVARFIQEELNIWLQGTGALTQPFHRAL